MGTFRVFTISFSIQIRIVRPVRPSWCVLSTLAREGRKGVSSASPWQMCVSAVSRWQGRGWAPTYSTWEVSLLVTHASRPQRTPPMAILFRSCEPQPQPSSRLSNGTNYAVLLRSECFHNCYTDMLNRNPETSASPTQIVYTVYTNFLNFNNLHIYHFITRSSLNWGTCP